MHAKLTLPAAERQRRRAGPRLGGARFGRDGNHRGQGYVKHGYSGTPLASKLGLKEGFAVALLGAPPGFRRGLVPLPPRISWHGALRPRLDCVVLFVPDLATLEARFAPAAASLAVAGMIWVAWPKKASKVPTDLTEDRVRAHGLACGLVDVKVCAVDEVWSGLKFVRRLADR
jgi:hypothetical protein